MAVDVIAGRFALCDPIASGSSGTVWRAWDLRERRYCAAKVLRQRDSGDLVRFTREQGVRLAHDHVLTPYTWVAEDAHVLIASDLMSGGSAATLLGDWGPLSPDTVADVLDQLLAGLDQVHSAGLVHRDVKLGNLLLDATSSRLHVRLADFGIAVGLRDSRVTQQGLVLGTPGYLSPEARAGAAPHPSQDLYAAGVCALALAQGVEPDGPVLPTVTLPGRVGTIVRALLVADPSHRPESAAAAREALAAQAAPTPRTTAGEPISVVEQLPPYPDHWDAAGPTTQALDESTPDGSTPDGSSPAESTPGRSLAGDSSAGDPSAGDSIAGDSGRLGPIRRAADTSARRRLMVVGAIVVLAFAGVATALIVRDDGSGAPSRTGTTGQTTTGRTAPTGPGNGSSPGTGGTQPPDRTPRTSSPVTAGATCSWQQEGDEVRVAAQTLRCTRRGTAYTWRKA